MMAHRQRRWAIIETALGQRIVFAGRRHGNCFMSVARQCVAQSNKPSIDLPLNDKSVTHTSFLFGQDNTARDQSSKHDMLAQCQLDAG